MIEPLPPGLARLVASERAASAGSSALRGVVRAKLGAVVGAAPLGAAGATLLGVTGKVIAVVAIAVGIGTTAAVLRGRRSSPVHVAARALPVHESARPIVEPLPPPSVEVAMPEAPARPPSRSAPKRRAEVHPATVSNDATELAVLAEARRALAHDDPSRALELTLDDERDHPAGALVEEREVIRISALAALHRSDETRAAAARFHERFPESIHRARVAHVLASLETP